MPITEEKTTKRKKFRVRVRATWYIGERKGSKELFKDEYVVTCGESVTAQEVFRHEHARVQQEHIPAEALDTSLMVDVDAVK